MKRSNFTPLLIICIAFSMLSFSTTNAQDYIADAGKAKFVSFKKGSTEKAESLKNWLHEVEQTRNIHFLMDGSLLDGKYLNNVRYPNGRIEKLLDKNLRQFDLTYLKVAKNTYVIIEDIEDGKIMGQITDKDGNPLIGASISIAGTSTGTVTDIDGRYEISLEPGTYQIMASYTGYTSQTLEVIVGEGQNVTQNFQLSEGAFLDEVVVLGSRSTNRTNTDSPVPVDVINVSEITAVAPQSNLNQIMHYAAPSFSSNTQTISDGTDHIDPASLRGLGPDQVLVLMNGKRRHTSSLVNVNGTFGRGQVGTDLNAIPAAAIANIEVLRDGAAAQYGSDAIAGVINLRLREDVNRLNVTFNTGANFTDGEKIGPFEGEDKSADGEVVSLGLNYGLPIGQNGGFINMTGDFDYRGATNRMREFAGGIFNAYNSIEWIASRAGADISNLSEDQIKSFAQQVGHFSSDFKSQISNAADLKELQGLLGGDVTEAELAARGQTRSDYNMRVGQSELRSGRLFANMEIPVGDNLEIYGFGGMGYRNGISGCFYRLPSQSRTTTSVYINGTVPKINSNIIDQSVSAGLRGQLNGWNVDFSNVWGRNAFNFYMTDTHNATIGSSTPVTFDSGGHEFIQNTSNFDISQYFYPEGIAGFNIAFGGEYRFENYKVIPGTELSWGNYDVNGNLVNSVTPDDQLATDALGRNRPSGAQCFAGFLPTNQVDANRSSVAAYFDTEFDITDNFLLTGAVRFENYSDFGSTFNYKIASRLKVNNNLAIRGAHSTGFRAPSLHQIHFSRTSTIFVTEGGATTAQEVGVFANTSRAANLLGIPELKQETSQNFSLGFTAKAPDAGLKLTVDAYQVNIEDRIVLTGQFRPGDDMELQAIFNQAQATRAAFFANAIDTETRGLDIVLAHSMLIGGGDAKLTNNFAATFSQTQQVGDIKASPLLEEKGLVSTYFDEESRIYLEEAVPRTQLTLSNSLNLGNLNIYLRNTFFGETTEATNISALDPGVDYTYSGKVVTDLSFGYSFTKDLNITIGANNLLDVYPDETDPAFQSSGRFLYSRRSPQFSFGGRHLFARIAFTL